MKNSKLLLILLLLTGIGILFWANPVVFLLVLTVLIVLSVTGSLGYITFCILEVVIRKNHEYGNEFFDYTMIPRKYNIIAMFIDWIDSFPQIIKKK